MFEIIFLIVFLGALIAIKIGLIVWIGCSVLGFIIGMLTAPRQHHITVETRS